MPLPSAGQVLVGVTADRSLVRSGARTWPHVRVRLPPAASLCPAPHLWGRPAHWAGGFEQLNSLLLATRLRAGRAGAVSPLPPALLSGKAPRGALRQLVSSRQVGRAAARRQAEGEVVPPSPLGHRGVACPSTGRGQGRCGDCPPRLARSGSRIPPRSQPRPPFSAGPEAPAGSRGT